MPPPTPSQQQDSTWCPLQSTGEALGFTSASDTLPLTHNQKVVAPAFKHLATPPPQDLPHAKALGPTPTVSSLEILLELVNRTVWDQEIFKFQEMDKEIRRMIRIDIAEEKSIAAKARHLEIEEVKRGRILRKEEKKRCFLKAMNRRLVELTIIETSSLAVEIVERMRAEEICMIVVKELLVEVHLEFLTNEKLREKERSLLDLAALQLSGTHILKKRKRLGRSKYKVRTV